MIRFRAFHVAAAVALLSALLFFLPAAADVPDKFTNLEVFPKDIGKRELVSAMRNFSIALGVRCEHCHVEKQLDNGEEEEDFASDDKEPKRVARAMMRMTGEINGKLLPTTGREHLSRVRCMTCHRGLTDPRSIDVVMLDQIDKSGLDAAIETYRELREQHADDGAYDFSAAPLGEVAQALAEQKQDMDGALAVARLNVELHPDAVRAHVMLGQMLAQSGDREAAIVALEKANELEPGNRWVQRMLGQLRQQGE